MSTTVLEREFVRVCVYAWVRVCVGVRVCSNPSQCSLSVDLLQEMKSISIPKSGWNRFLWLRDWSRLGKKSPTAWSEAATSLWQSFPPDLHLGVEIRIPPSAYASKFSASHKFGLRYLSLQRFRSDWIEPCWLHFFCFCACWDNIWLDESFLSVFCCMLVRPTDIFI